MAARAELVKSLRTIARARGVARVRDNAAREKVLAMVTDIRKKPLEREDRQKLEDAVSAYLASFPAVPVYIYIYSRLRPRAKAQAESEAVRGAETGRINY